MNVVIVGVVSSHVLERIPGEGEPAVVVDRLHRRDDEKEERLSRREADEFVREYAPARVEGEAFERMVVQRAERVRDVETVVPRVDGPVEIRDLVRRPVHHVLPAVENEPVRLKKEVNRRVLKAVFARTGGTGRTLRRRTGLRARPTSR